MHVPVYIHVMVECGCGVMLAMMKFLSKNNSYFQTLRRSKGSYLLNRGHIK